MRVLRVPPMVFVSPAALSQFPWLWIIDRSINLKGVAVNRAANHVAK